MTDENKLFRYIWRFNALVFAVVGIAACWAFIGDLLNPVQPTEPVPAGNFAPIPRAAEKGFTYRLQSHGERRSIGAEKIIALDRWKGAPETYGLQRVEFRDNLQSSVSQFSSSRSVNLLAVNQRTAESHWIFPGYDRAIIAEDSISDSVPVQSFPPSSIALTMTVIESDSNKDGELSEKDRQSLYVYRPGARRAVRLLTADLILSRQQPDTGHYLVIYENGNAAVAATFSVPEFKLIGEKTLPKVPNG